MSNKVTSIKVRMYNTGSVGDCILLLFQKGANTSFSMLVDCGGIKTSSALVTPCVEDIRTTVNGKLDLLIVTHEHEDHISGFNLARPVFDAISVKETWMSWVEDKTDTVAIILKKKYGKKLKELRRITELGLQKLKAQSHARSEVKDSARTLNMRKNNLLETMSLLDFEEGFSHGRNLAPGSRTNADAMNYVKGKGKKISYKLPGEVIKDLPGAEGIKFFILGPPRENDLKFLKIDMDEEEMYHLAAKSVEVEDTEITERIFKSGIVLEDGISPFSKEFCCSASEEKTFFKLYNSRDYKWRQIETDWLESESSIALALTRLVNNTSLAMALEFDGSGEVLLLPADAQSGNWMSWHKPEVMKSLKSKGGKDTEELLKNTIFYKVGHHGSHNGTASKSGLQLINNNRLVAFMPLVQDKVPVKWGGADNFPAKSLNKVLINKTKGRLIRTDEGLVTDTQAKKLRANLSTGEKKDLQNNFKEGPCYYEYTVKMS